MTRSEYTQHADRAMREVKLPPGVEVIRMIHGQIDGVDTLLAATTDGIYRVDSTGIATKLTFPHRHTYQCRCTDRDYRPLWIALVVVLTALALWSTF